MNTWLPWLVLAALPGFTLVSTVFNLAFWPRGRTDGDDDVGGSMSVLIPARNEAGTIERCIRSIYRGGVEVDEVLVYEDRSTDATPEILDRLADEFESLEILEGRPLPEGWVGKPHACHRLAGAADGSVLVFLDADTVVEENGLVRLMSILEEGPAGPSELVTAVPRQTVGSLAEALVVPLLHLTYTSWLPLPLIWRTSEPRFLAANGQVAAVRAKSLDAVGGFEAIRADVVDDMALGRRFKEDGRRVTFADGFEIARCRMYESWRQVWEGFSKNLFEGLGQSVGLLAVVIALYGLAFLAPWIVAPVAWAAGFDTIFAAAVAGVGCNVILRVLLAVRFRHPPSAVVFHPLGVGVMLAIAINSWAWHRRGEIRWADRTYVARDQR